MGSLGSDLQGGLESCLSCCQVENRLHQIHVEPVRERRLQFHILDLKMLIDLLQRLLSDPEFSASEHQPVEIFVQYAN